MLVKKVSAVYVTGWLAPTRQLYVGRWQMCYVLHSILRPCVLRHLQIWQHKLRSLNSTVGERGLVPEWEWDMRIWECGRGILYYLCLLRAVALCVVGEF